MCIKLRNTIFNNQELNKNDLIIYFNDLNIKIHFVIIYQ